MRNRSSRLTLAALLLTVAAATTNCLAQTSTAPTDSSSAAITPGYSWLRIRAFVNVPLAGANVAVYDTAGDVIFQQDDATNRQGVFPAHIQNLPRNFRVTVTFDGNAQQDPGLGSLGRFTLSAEVRNFDPVYGIVYVNPATTLVSRAMRRLPDHNLETARDRVRRFLQLPQNYSLGDALWQGTGYKSPYFSESAFMTAVRQYGGMETSLNAAAQLLTKPGFPTHSFADAPPAGAANPLAFIGLNLAKGALVYLAGRGVGWVLGSGDKPAPPGVTPQDISSVQEGLADLQASVDGLKSQLDALNREVKAQLTKIQYDLIAVQALPLASKVNDVEDDMTYFALGCPPILETDSGMDGRRFGEFCTAQRRTIEAQLSSVDINKSFGTLSTYLLDNKTVGFDGMIHLYSQSLGQAVRFFRAADSTKLERMFEFWSGVQTQSANLKVELLHLNGAQNNPGGVKQLTDFLGDAEADPATQGTFQKTLEVERKLMFPAVPAGAVIHTRDQIMWLIQYPVNGGTCGPPPDGSGAWNYPLTEPVTIDGLKWLSPSRAEAKALIEGWTGPSQNQWLIEQTRAVAPDMPESPGFPDVVHFHASCPVPFYGIWPVIWTRDYTGETVTFFGHTYKVAYVVGMKLGPEVGDKGVVGSIEYDWLALDRRLNAGEQYYWYPGQ